MKQNILLVGYDFETASKCAEKLAEFFSMRVLNEVELFEFDYAPRTIENLISLRGEKFVKEKLNKIVMQSYEYENVILVADLSIYNILENNFSDVSNDYVTVFLYDDPTFEYNELLKKPFSPELKKLFLYNDKELEEIHTKILKSFDIGVKTSGLNLMEIVFKVIGSIKAMYSKN